MKANREMNTIRGTVKRAHEEGYCVAECALRRWVCSGEIPCVRSGKRVYINWHQFLVFIGANQQNDAAQA